MTEQVLTNAKVIIDGFDMSGSMNAIALDYGAEIKDKTTFGDASRRKVAGLKSLTWNHEGYWRGGDDDVDDVLFSRVGKTVAMTIAADGIEEEDPVFINNVVLSNYNPGAAVGDVFQFSVGGESESEFVRSTVLINEAVTINDSSTPIIISTLNTTQTLFANVHVLAASASSTLDLVLESDDNVSFISPVTRYTFDQITDVGAKWMIPIRGPFTPNDYYFRINYTLGGTNPAFTFIVSAGVKKTR